MEFGARPESEQRFQIEIPDQAVDRHLAVFLLDFGKNKPGAVTVVTTAHPGLHGQQFAGFFERHDFDPLKTSGIGSRGPFDTGVFRYATGRRQRPVVRLNYFSSKSEPSFFFTATFFNCTYFGMPFLPYGG